MLQTISKVSDSNEASISSIHADTSQEMDERSIQQRLTRNWSAIFIDGANLYHAAQRLEIEIELTLMPLRRSIWMLKSLLI